MPEDAANLVEEYEAGRLDLSHHRGRSIHPRLLQAAEHFLRESMGLTGLDDLTIVEYRRSSHDQAEVVFRVPEGDRLPGPGWGSRATRTRLPDLSGRGARARHRL